MAKNIILIIIAFVVLACGNRDKKTLSSSSSTPETTVDGAVIYKQKCEICHGPDGKLGANGSKDLTISDFDINERIVMISKGKGAMTAFEGILSLTEIRAVAEYSISLKK